MSWEMDELRKERKTFVGHRCYVTTAGVERGDDAVQQRMADIDAKVTALYARAKEQLVTVTAKDLTIGASTLRFATNESKAVRDFIAQETKRHSDAMMTFIALQEQSGVAFRDAVKTMEAAAENLTDGGEEQAPEPGAAVAGAGSSTDMACPNCSKICRGVKGLARHQRGCKAVIDVEQVLDAESLFILA